ncbi:hypothetical protein DQ354_09860 [Arthrobacter sp. AQ5-06]|nr:hypothetical protein DQ354_09860 [Arthrobacter sp. AQ5-06]
MVRDGVHYSAMGAHALPGNHPWSEGPAMLLIRQERIVLFEEHSQGLPAVVTGIRTRGPRRLVTAEAADVNLYAEATASPALATGDTVRIQLPTSALAAVGGVAEHRSAALDFPRLEGFSVTVSATKN